jgi:hypothetical protein
LFSFTLFGIVVWWVSESIKVCVVTNAIRKEWKIMINCMEYLWHIMVCGSHFRGNLQITPDGLHKLKSSKIQRKRIDPAKGLKLIIGYLASFHISHSLISLCQHSSIASHISDRHKIKKTGFHWLKIQYPNWSKNREKLSLARVFFPAFNDIEQ